MKRLPAFIFLAVFLAASPAPAAEGGQTASPAGAFSQDTILYVEILRPVDTIDAASRMSFFPEAASLLEAVAAAGGRDSAVAASLADAMRSWATDPELRRQLEALAGNRLALGVCFPPGLSHAAAVVAASGKSGDNPVEALQALASRFLKHDWRISAQIPDRKREGQWVVFGTPSLESEADRLAAALSTPGAVRPDALSGLQSFQEAMASLPAEPAQVRGFVNTAALLRLISENFCACRPMRAFAENLLNRIDGLGFARNIGPDTITTWIGGPVHRSGEDGIADFLRSVAPVKKPLFHLLPDGALSAYEIGAPPGKCMGALGTLLEEAIPRLHGKIALFFDDFRSSTGLDPARDLFPHLGPSVAVAVLPAEKTSGGWPLPRPVFLARTDNDPAVRDFLRSFFRWEAGAVAPLTQGLVSARFTSETHNGVELMGLQAEGIFPMPLPSPACGMTNGVLVFSPFRSAAGEAIDSIRSRSNAIPLPGDVERFHIDLAAWGAELEKLAGIVPHAGPASEPPAAGFVSAVSRVLHALGPMEGVTTLREDGAFLCRMELRPGRSGAQE
jgi:hypothetical protein